MSDRGRSRSPKPLSPAARHPNGRDVSMSRSPSRGPRSISRSRSRSFPPRHGATKGNTVVVITGLTKNVQKGHLEEIFAPYGRIVAVDLPTFEVSGLNKGKAAIQYEDAAEAEKAASHMDGGQLDNAFLKVVTSEHPIPPPARSPRRPISRSPIRRRRSPSYSRSPSPRGGRYRARSPSPPRGYRGPPPGDRRFPSGGGYPSGPRGGGGFGGRGCYGGRGGYGARGGYGGPGGGGPGGPGPAGGRYRSRSPPRRPMDRGGPRRPSPMYGGRRSYSRSLSRSRSPRRPRSVSRDRSYSRSPSRSLSPPPRRKRAYSRSLTPSRSRSPVRRSYSRSVSRSPRK
ncbi:hypothetical protein DB88DRAFT_479687 [Papiliotrema laurentii]|uniref:RRM domain-containing protein n=1 Tax=Papiliotrema laurentii TaxID=5418 RepID=A0AAD9L949_PAPLA|nr:hypothetical protein DB88DRAFT_479687 [Papiliotrema laurentii]